MDYEEIYSKIIEQAFFKYDEEQELEESLKPYLPRWPKPSIRKRKWDGELPPILRSGKPEEFPQCIQCGNFFHQNGCICITNTTECVEWDVIMNKVKNRMKKRNKNRY